MRVPVKALADAATAYPPPTGLFPDDWTTVAVIPVYLADLHFTRTTVSIGPLFGVKSDTAGADGYPHVVSWRGELYLISDHAPVVYHAMLGTRVMRMRVFVQKEDG